MTPVIKAFFTDMGFEAANLAMQCYGGHGYIRDNGVEQFVRDGRINQTYEGANGVQAMDLVGRKLGRKGGAAPLALFGADHRLAGRERERRRDGAVREGREARPRHPAAARRCGWRSNGLANPNNAGAGATDYLRMMGIVVVGWMWARMAKVAQRQARRQPAERRVLQGEAGRARNTGWNA